ncbi:hypothetical protein IWGMT90018_14320 [Mycobacterium kiyosense]|nr:hypothetical protein IWGMT90018_14320 [Mycobacterium kiyosense]
MIDSWKLSSRAANTLLPAIESALARGWPVEDLTEHLIRHPQGAREPIRVIGRRLTEAWHGADPPVTTVPWCGECEDAHFRTITVTAADGTEAARFCPQCSPQIHRGPTSVQTSGKNVERW